jgi:ribosomal protein S18 acetylase RimI-like enzyme
MTSSGSEIKIQIRPLQYRDIQTISNLGKELETVKQWYGLLKFLKYFPNPLQDFLWLYVAQIQQQCIGVVQVVPFNKSRSTWRVQWVLVDKTNLDPELSSGRNSIGSQLLRHCFETIWEARTWLLEVNIHEKSNLALYRQNGFQPLAQLTYWCIDPEKLAQLADHEPQLPNLLPISNAEAQLLYQLDTVSMPPLLRQVFDRHPQDFKTNLVKSLLNRLKPWFNAKEITSGYVFEPQRKAAIAYYKLEICKDGSHPHRAELTVHPAYTWLYPELLAQMAKIAQNYPQQALELASADYQSEREEFLEKLGAEQVENTLLMSRSVWHKLRESRPLEGLQLSDVLKGLHPARTPIPSRMSWLESRGETLPQSHPETDNPETNNHNR